MHKALGTPSCRQPGIDPRQVPWGLLLQPCPMATQPQRARCHPCRLEQERAQATATTFSSFFRIHKARLKTGSYFLKGHVETSLREHSGAPTLTVQPASERLYHTTLLLALRSPVSCWAPNVNWCGSFNSIATAQVTLQQKSPPWLALARTVIVIAHAGTRRCAFLVISAAQEGRAEARAPRRPVTAANRRLAHTVPTTKCGRVLQDSEHAPHHCCWNFQRYLNRKATTGASLEKELYQVTRAPGEGEDCFPSL